MDWGMISTIINIAIAAAGAFFWFWGIPYDRRESRLSSLTAIISPMIQCWQFLNDALCDAKAIQQLQRAFPDPSKAPDAAVQVNYKFSEYSKNIAAGALAHKEYERELGSRKFRFPDKISEKLMNLRDLLSNLALDIQTQRFDRADIVTAKISSIYKEINGHARGWRLSDPFEGLKKRFLQKKQVDPKLSKYEITENQMNDILDLVHKRFTGQDGNTFAVYPPEKLLKEPSIQTSDDVIEQLEDSVFEVVFQDGTHRLMGLPELMVFIYQLIFLASHGEAIDQFVENCPGDGELKLTMKFSMDQVMNPEVVKALLSKVEFEPEASDAESQNGPLSESV